MMTSEFTAELGAFIRSAEQKIRLEPDLQHTTTVDNALDAIEQAIIRLVALHIYLRKATSDDR